jgi:hypothetical protein
VERNQTSTLDAEQPTLTPTNPEISNRNPPSAHTNPSTDESDEVWSAPNISLNLHDGSKHGELYAAALCGIILQFGMLVFCGFSIYHPTFSQRFPKNGRPVQRYAFPIMALGTILLMLGMLICSAIVNLSTKEEEYAPTTGPSAAAEYEPNIRLLWLQKSHTVSDQAFDSFVLFGQSSGRCNHILTSWRQQTTTPSADLDPSEESHSSFSSQIPATNLSIKLRKWVEICVKKIASKIASNPTEAFTLLGVFFGLCSFILQFQVSFDALCRNRFKVHNI